MMLSDARDEFGDLARSFSRELPKRLVTNTDDDLEGFLKTLESSSLN